MDWPVCKLQVCNLVFDMWLTTAQSRTWSQDSVGPYIGLDFYSQIYPCNALSRGGMYIVNWLNNWRHDGSDIIIKLYNVYSHSQWNSLCWWAWLSGWRLLLMLINHKHNNDKGVENYFFNHSELWKSANSARRANVSGERSWRRASPACDGSSRSA